MSSAFALYSLSARFMAGDISYASALDDLRALGWPKDLAEHFMEGLIELRVDRRMADTINHWRARIA